MTILNPNKKQNEKYLTIYERMYRDLILHLIVSNKKKDPDMTYIWITNKALMLLLLENHILWYKNKMNYHEPTPESLL